MNLRSTINAAASHLAQLSGLNAALRRAQRHRLLVLCYHGVVPRIPAGESYFYRNAVPSELFDRQMHYVARHFHPVSATEVLDSLQNRTQLPERSVLVSFDDGYRNNLTVAAPILERHGIPAMIALTTELIGTSELLWPTEVDLRVLHWPTRDIVAPDGRSIDVPEHESARAVLAARLRAQCKSLPDSDRRAYVESLRDTELPTADTELVGFLDWDEARELHRRGFAIASHTMTHPILSRTPDERLATEVRDSRARIEQELDAPCDCFVYPNGGAEDVSPRTRAALADAGYRAGFILCGQPNPVAPTEPLEIDRLSVPCHAGMPVWATHVSGLRSRLRRLVSP